MDILIIDNCSPESSIETIMRSSRRDAERNCTINTIHTLEDLKNDNKAPDIIIFVTSPSDATPGSSIHSLFCKYPNSAMVIITSSETNLENDSSLVGIQDYIDRENVNVGSIWKSVNYAYSRKKMELVMLSDRENLDKANSILKVTSEISRSILAGQTNLEDMMTSIGGILGVDGVAVFCGKCLQDGIPYCAWTGGKIKEETYLSTDCKGNEPLSEDISSFIRYNLPVFTMIENAPLSVRSIISWNAFSNKNKVVIVPIMMDNEPWGMFCFYTINGKTWSVAEMDALATLSRLGGAIVRNKQLEDEMLEEVEEKFSEVNRLMNKEES